MSEDRVLPEQKDDVAKKPRSLTLLSRTCNPRWMQVSQLDMKMCNKCASQARSSVLNKLNIFSWIDLTVTF